ncbi:MAG: thioredoxin domain-containing protein [Myxococcota bacterium]
MANVVKGKKMKRVAAWLGCTALLIAQGCEQMGCQQQNKLEKRIADIDSRLQKIERLLPKPPKPQEKPYTISLVTELEENKTYTSPILGKQDAPVSVIVYSDFQCPFCKRSNPMLKQIVNDPELKDKVNVVFKHFPLSFHKQAKPAAKASIAAHEQGKFWEFADKLYEDPRNLTKKNFEKWIQDPKVGGNKIALVRALIDNDKQYEDIIKKDMDTGIKVAKVNGTPNFYVGKRVGNNIEAWKVKQGSLPGIKQLIKDKKLLDLGKKAKTGENKENK